MYTVPKPKPGFHRPGVLGRWIWGLAASVFMAGTAALAADGGEPATAANVMSLSLDQLLGVNVEKVYGASKYDQPVSRAPASVSLITRDEVRKQGYRTLADNLTDERRGFSGSFDHLQDTIPLPSRSFRVKATCHF